MDNKVPVANEKDKLPFPWLTAYPPGVPARIETPPYRLLGEIARGLSGAEAGGPGVYHHHAERHGWKI